MDQVINRQPPAFVWPTVGHPGRVPLNALVPDPEQPRKDFNKEELAALAETMKKENDGEQREIITVAHLRAEDAARYSPGRYSIVSGERRWRAAHWAGLADVEIRVKKYASRAKQKLDMYMLNEGRVGLSNIENARYMAELMREFKLDTQENLAQLIGKDQVYVSQHLSLLKLIPEVQALMDPSIPERSRLRMGTALILCRLDESVQRDISARMPQGDGVSTRRQVDWIKAELAKGDIKLEKRRLSAGTMRRVLLYFAENFEKRVAEISGFEEFDRIFDNATLAQAQDLVGRVTDAQNELEDLMKRIRGLLAQKEAAKNDTKTKAAAFVQRQVQLKELPKPKEAPAVRPQAPAPPRQPPAVALMPRRASPPVFHASKAAPEAPKAVRRVERTFNVYDDVVGRIVSKLVTRERYVELWDARKLGFQHESKPKPEFMPTRKGALGDEWNN